MPRLRLVDIRPLMHEGRRLLMLRDPLHLREEAVLLAPEAWPVLLLCDGTKTPGAICGTLRRQYGIDLAQSLIDELIAVLDSAYLLENARFRAARARVQAEYRAAPFRPPALAGAGYPADPDALAALLQGYFDAEPDVDPASDAGRGLLSPHIDYTRGYSVYARTWKRAAPMIQSADLVVLIGTDHFGSEPISLTRQHYATPFGMLPTDLAIVDALAAALGEEAAFAGELYHRSEHSIELPAVWLHFLRRTNPCPIVPILCGSFARFVQGAADLDQDDLMNRLLETLRLMTSGRNVVYLASGDLAHVGPAFGGAPLQAAARQALSREDDTVLAEMARGDARAFFDAIAAIGDRNNICGLSPIYLTLRALEETRGELVAYEQCPADDAFTSVVSIGGMVFA